MAKVAAIVNPELAPATLQVDGEHVPAGSPVRVDTKRLTETTPAYGRRVLKFLRVDEGDEDDGAVH